VSAAAGAVHQSFVAQPGKQAVNCMAAGVGNFTNVSHGPFEQL